MKSSLVSEIAEELSLKYGKSVASRKAEIKAILRDRQDEVKEEKEVLGSKEEAELYVLLNHYCMVDEEFSAGQ